MKKNTTLYSNNTTRLHNRKHKIMTREEKIIKASREYAMNKSNENNTWFVDYKDIEEAFVAGAKFACDYIETSNNERRTEHGSDN